MKISHWVAFMAIVGSIQAAAAELKYRLHAHPGSKRLSQVEAIVEIAGQLRVNPDGKRVIDLPITGKGEFKYFEKEMSSADAITHLQTIRHYSLAKADFRIGERDVTNRLGDEHPRIRVAATDSRLTLFSPTGPLTHEELELIDIQAHSAILSRLLPDKEVAVGEKWQHSDKLAAMFLGLDVVTEVTLQSTLDRVENQVAFIEMNGDVQGSVSGVTSDIELTAKYQFDLKDHRITWLAMSVKEKRAVGHAEPGFDVTARVRVAVVNAESFPDLSDEVISAIPTDSNEAMTWLSFTSEPGAFRFLHDRNWHVMVDRHDVTILRLVENGELLAQCNITRLLDTTATKQLTMQSFQADIRRVLDKNFGQFADSTESQNEKGVRTLRSIVSGMAADLPIQWNYYHLTDDHGHQVTLVFTMESSLVPRFGAADQVLVENLEILPRSIPSSPAGAKSASNAAKDSPTR